MHFTWFDILILVILGLSTIFGAHKGLIRILISITSFILSIYLSYALYPYIVPFVNKYIENEVIVSMICGSFAYIISIIICSLLSYRIKALLGAKTIIDRLLGLFIGFARGCVICLTLFASIIIFSSGSYIEAETVEDLVIKATKDKYPSWLKKSLSEKYLTNSYNNIITIITMQTLKSLKLPTQKDKNDIMDIIEKSAKNNNSSKNNEGFFSKELEIDLNDGVLD